MYQAHFGLLRAPFKITPDTSLFYSGAERGSVLQALMYAVMSGEGIVKVIGEVGTGKTMLCRMLEMKLPEEVQTVYVANPGLSPENILNVIAFELELISKPASKLEVMQILQRWLLEQYGKGRKVVVLIEEAQGMPLETLEEIRLLSNIETEQDKLMQIVLFGQPELDENLSQPSIRQLNERISHGFYLSPLKKPQIKDYLNFRIRTAGYHGPDLFDEPVAKTLAKHSKGLIRRVNILADKTLLAAFADGTTRLDKSHAKKAIKDSGFFSFRKMPKMVYIAGAVGLIIGVVSVGMYGWFDVQANKQYSDQVDSSAERELNNGKTSELQKTPQGSEDAQLEEIVVAATVSEEVVEINQADVDVAKPEAAEKKLQIDLDSAAEMPADLSAEVNDKKNATHLESNEKAQPFSAQAPEVLVTRLDATEHWLKNADEGEYSIQIMTLKRDSSGGLKDFLYRLSKDVNVDEIFVYRTVLNGQPMFGILYKTFNNRGLAVSALREIPDELNEHRPFLLRTVKGVRNEIARSNG